MARTKSKTYEGYRGTKRFLVWHPKFGAVRVTAPDSDSAMVTAANIWGTKWTALDFYTACMVSKA